MAGGEGLTPALRAGARELSHALLELLLPRQCVACERLLAAGERGLMCGVCWSRLPVLPQPQCDRCGHRWTTWEREEAAAAPIDREAIRATIASLQALASRE